MDSRFTLFFLLLQEENYFFPLSLLLMRFVQLQSPGVLLLPIYGVNCDGALASFLLDVLVNKSGENLRVIYR